MPRAANPVKNRELKIDLDSSITSCRHCASQPAIRRSPCRGLEVSASPFATPGTDGTLKSFAKQDERKRPSLGVARSRLDENWMTATQTAIPRKGPTDRCSSTQMTCRRRCRLSIGAEQKQSPA